RGALPTAGHLHLRRAGIGVVTVAANRIPQAAASHGPIRNLPGDHGDPFAHAHGLSRRAAVAAVEIRARAGYGRNRRTLPADARVLERSEILHRDDARGMNSMRAPADRAPFRPTDNRIRLTPSNQSRRAQGGPPWLTKPFLVANFCLEPALPAR